MGKREGGFPPVVLAASDSEARERGGDVLGLFRCAEKRFNRAADLDDHRISAAILSGGNFNTHPTFGHVVFVNIGFLGAIKANTHAAAERLFAIERAVLVNGKVIRWNVGDLILGHDWLSLNAGRVSRRFVKNLRDLDGHDAGGGVGSAAQDDKARIRIGAGAHDDQRASTAATTPSAAVRRPMLIAPEAIR